MEEAARNMSEATMVIYKITNTVNGKIYVGRDKHNNSAYLGSGKLIAAAIKKYGRENFTREILDYASTVEELNRKEIYWIEKTNSRDLSIGYNLQKGGEGGDWDALTIDQQNYVRKRVGESSKVRIRTPEEIQKMRSSMKGKNTGPRSLEVCQKMSRNRRGIVPVRKGKYRLCDKAKAELSIRVSGEGNGMFGKRHSAESKDKMRIKSMGRPGSTTGIFKNFYLYENDTLKATLEGQAAAILYCKEHKLPYSIIIKKFLKWKNWECRTSILTI